MLLFYGFAQAAGGRTVCMGDGEEQCAWETINYGNVEIIKILEKWLALSTLHRRTRVQISIDDVSLEIID